MSDEFDAEAFLDWLDTIDDYHVSRQRVEDEWPSFEHDRLVGVTMQYDPDTGETRVPKRDYRHAVVHGYPLD